MKLRTVKEIKDVEKLADGRLRLVARMKRERSDTVIIVPKMEFRILKEYAKLW